MENIVNFDNENEMEVFGVSESRGTKAQ